jgi:ABC-2 type transport system permease protein
MKMTWIMTVASLKMYLRQKETVIWAFFFPLLLLGLFGFIRFDGVGTLHLGVVNAAGTNGAPIVERFRHVSALEVFEGMEEAERAQLMVGERDLLVIIPPEYGQAGASRLTVLADREAKPRETQLATLIVQKVMDDAVFAGTDSLRRTTLDVRAVTVRNLTYVDFLLPGVLSMSIMQLGIFGVAFAFVTLKRRGILRRLKVTPLQPREFITAQVLSRLVVVVAQIALMLVFGVYVLHVHFLGNPFLLLSVAMLGATVFLAIGFAIAGIARSEDQVPPMANAITLPMLLLSGVFFSRSNLPEVVRLITGVLPLTHLADAMRAVAIDGAGVADIMPQLIGLGIWAPVSIGLAVWLFRWE